MSADATVNTAGRLISLDVFRGITIAGMVLVNNPGTWGAIYSPLKHAEWHGWTPTDFIFPFFLFIVGIAIPLALGKRVDEGGVKAGVYLKIVRRSIVIFLLGIFLASFPFYDFAKGTWFDWSMLRIPGVLQRIAVCFLITSLIFLHTNWRQQSIIAVVLLFLYWILMTVVPVPGCELTTIDDKACNLAAYIDRMILTENHIWKAGKVYDPEGILSTIPAISTTLAGVLTGHWLKTKRDDMDKVAGMFFFGIVLVAIGWGWHLLFPINKPLWTSSYVVFTAGMALCFLAFCYWLIDIKGYKAWTKPFVIFGVNALALFVGSGMMARLLGIIKVPGAEGNYIALQKFIFDNFYLSWTSPINASLAYAITFILVWLFIMWLLYRRQVYIKV